ncbi:l1 transposable element-related [Holotrichia oblita]|uniref:L1 transposable element-related n=1 Tax=Holotrichia oblita TaxID=644536 RepID=A0ACB9TF23_HOLOL|nr:l1 transposable element-related [Holotrichia oblita]
MPITRELASEIKALFKDFIEDFLKSEQFLKHLTDTFTKNINKKLDHMFDAYGKKLTELEAENKTLSTKIDDIEQYSRRSNIRIVGLPEEVSQNTMDKVLTFCSEKLDLKMGSNDIDRCHRVGKPLNGHRALLIKFVSYNVKQAILKRRAALKNTRIFIVEDLTKMRYMVHKAVQQKYGKKNTWTHDGSIYVRVGNAKHRVWTMEEVSNLK